MTGRERLAGYVDLAPQLGVSMSLLSLVLAAALPVADAAPVLDTAEQQRHDVLWDALWSVLDPDKVYDVRSLEARSLELEQRGFHCLTEVILEIKARPELFSEAELAEIEAALIKPTPRVEEGALASSGSAEESSSSAAKTTTSCTGSVSWSSTRTA